MHVDLAYDGSGTFANASESPSAVCIAQGSIAQGSKVQGSISEAQIMIPRDLHKNALVNQTGFQPMTS